MLQEHGMLINKLTYLRKQIRTEYGIGESQQDLYAHSNQHSTGKLMVGNNFCKK